jgi:hypothetical protein
MNLTPINNMALVIESKDDAVQGHSALQGIGFASSSEKNLGVKGRIHRIGANDLGLKEGMEVIYSQYVSEQLDLRDDEGKQIENLRSVPIDSIIAIVG